MRPVLYLRMSRASQDTSIPEQRKSLQRLAKEQDATIVREYVDAAISGDATERRTAFQKMIADAAHGDFDTILCWDQDRFGRFNSIEAGYWIFPLVQAGVRLVTIAQGTIDWAEFSGRMIYAIQQEGKHDFLRSVSRNSARGLAAVAARGEWVSGTPPYGYSVHKRKLRPEPVTAKIVKQIFAWYLAGDSLRVIALKLNDKAVSSYKGGKWNPTTIRRILTNRTYLGEFSWNVRQRGKYTRIREGKVVDAKHAEVPTDNPSDRFVFPGCHDALVSESDFIATARKLVGNRFRTTPIRGGGGFLFTSLLKCGHCGFAMAGRMGPSPWKHAFYQCNGYRAQGGTGCHHKEMLRQDLLSQVVNDALRTQLIAQFDPREMRKTLVREIERMRERASVDDLEKQLRVLSKKTQAAKRRIIEVDAEFIPIVQDEIRSLAATQADLTRRIQAATDGKSSVAKKADDLVERAVAEFHKLRESLDSVDAGSLRELYISHISKMDIEFSDIKTNRVTLPKSAIIYLRLDSELVQSATVLCTSYRGMPVLRLKTRDFERVA